MSEVKVNKISPRSGTEVTLGDSGDTFTIPSGATINNQGTATNFGPTGSVSWQTTVKSAGFTATAGEGYFIDTSSGAVSVNLPAGTAGAVVGFSDYAQSFDTNALTLVQNGSDKIAGSTDNSELLTEGIAVTLVFVDSTKGWIVTDSGLQSDAPGPTFVTATGGNAVVTCGNFKTHIFTGPGTFAVSALSGTSSNNVADYLVVAGGGGAAINGGGGGAGGFRSFSSVPGTNSPLNAPAGLTLTAASFPITVGSGGADGAPSGPPSSAPSAPGNASTFSTITSAGGGGANRQGTCSANGKPGGSGGGGGYPCGAGGTGNTPPTSPPQGQNGGVGQVSGGPHFAGGGGAGAAGCGGAVPNAGGAGSFIQTGFIGPTSPSYGETGPQGRFFSGGGGGSNQAPGSPYPVANIAGGLGGGGNGAVAPENAGSSGVVNTGGGGGTGNGGSAPGGSTGGSGIVMIRYKFQ